MTTNISVFSHGSMIWKNASKQIPKVLKEYPLDHAQHHVWWKPNAMYHHKHPITTGKHCGFGVVLQQQVLIILQ